MNYLNPFQQYACYGPNGWPYWNSEDIAPLNRAIDIPGNRFVSVSPDRTAYIVWYVAPTTGAQFIASSGEGYEIQLPQVEPVCERFYRPDRPYAWAWTLAAAALGAGIVFGVSKVFR